MHGLVVKMEDLVGCMAWLESRLKYCSFLHDHTSSVRIIFWRCFTLQPWDSWQEQAGFLPFCHTASQKSAEHISQCKASKFSFLDTHNNMIIKYMAYKNRSDTPEKKWQMRKETLEARNMK